MATVKFILQGKKELSPINLRLSIRRDKVLKRTIGKDILVKDWSKAAALPLPKSENLKELRQQLRDLENDVLKVFERDSAANMEITGDWLQNRIDIFFKRKEETVIRSDEVISNLITDNIQRIIDTASTRENVRGGLGISKSRINSYKTLLGIFQEFQGKDNYKVSDVDVKFGKQFLIWLIDECGYAESYAKKRLEDLKTVCLDADVQGVTVSKQLKRIKVGKSKSAAIIFLSPKELEQIKKTELKSEALSNARRWLLLGCNIGQRGGDLLKLSERNFVTRRNLDLIELQQQKTGKMVTIPILPETKTILESGLPHKISMQNFNDYLKDICRLAEIDESMEGSKIKMVKGRNGKLVKRKVFGTYKKWELISSHVCRRSFATNKYGFLPTPLIMQVTGHRSEKTFLGYIGKTGIDFAQQISDFYAKQELEVQ